MTQLTRLKAGQVAPTFNLLDIYGTKINLKSYKNDKLLLCFFRYAGCPWCNLAIQRLTMSYPELQKENLKVIAFVQSEPENIKKYILDRHNPKPAFPIIADPERLIYDQYGVSDSLVAASRSLVKLPSWLQAKYRNGFDQGKIDGSLTLVPAQFLLERNKIYKANYGVNYYDNLPIVEIMNFALFGSE
jgi:peroxiredoxin Q/BCP